MSSGRIHARISLGLNFLYRWRSVSFSWSSLILPFVWRRHMKETSAQRNRFSMIEKKNNSKITSSPYHVAISFGLDSWSCNFFSMRISFRWRSSNQRNPCLFWWRFFSSSLYLSQRQFPWTAQRCLWHKLEQERHQEARISLRFERKHAVSWRNCQPRTLIDEKR